MGRMNEIDECLKLICAHSSIREIRDEIAVPANHTVELVNFAKLTYIWATSKLKIRPQISQISQIFSFPLRLCASALNLLQGVR